MQVDTCTPCYLSNYSAYLASERQKAEAALHINSEQAQLRQVEHVFRPDPNRLVDIQV